MTIHDAITQAIPVRTRTITILGGEADKLRDICFRWIYRTDLPTLHSAEIERIDMTGISALWFYITNPVAILASVSFTQRGLHTDIRINRYDPGIYQDLAVDVVSELENLWQENFEFEFLQSAVQDFRTKRPKTF